MSLLRIAAEAANHDRAVTWLKTECAVNRIGKEDAARLAIVVEELLLNVSTYNGAPPPTVELTFVREPLALQLDIEDDGVAFDPTIAAPPNLSDDIEDRGLGGLGIHMVMSLMDEVTYTREGNRNRLVLRKFITAN